MSKETDLASLVVARVARDKAHKALRDHIDSYLLRYDEFKTPWSEASDTLYNLRLAFRFKYGGDEPTPGDEGI